MNAPSATVFERHSVRYGSERIDFELSRSDRKTLAITAHPDLSVSVVAPFEASLDKILEKVRGRSPWILKQKRQFLAWMPKPRPRAYRGGETHRYLGRQYQLKVVASEDRSTKLKGGYLTVSIPEPNDAKAAKRQVVSWYREKASLHFHQQVELGLTRLSRYNLGEPKLRIRVMHKRWGSCTHDGEILLNPELMKAPILCVEYVVMHELCHLRHPNHSRAFFRMLDAVLPDWRARKARLERVEV